MLGDGKGFFITLPEAVMSIVCVGVDLAKNVFAIHGVDEVGKAVWVQPRVPRAQLLAAFSNLPSCLIGMEACSGAHHWARQLLAMGHKVRLIAPKFVTPYRLGGKRGKNDAADAAAICEAVQRPHLRFVPIKSVEQQARMAVHRMLQQQFGGKTCVSPTHSHVAKQDLAPDVVFEFSGGPSGPSAATNC